MKNAILAVNAGSSSLKFALYPHSGKVVEAAQFSGNIEGLEPGGTVVINLSTPGGNTKTSLGTTSGEGFERALAALNEVLASHATDVTISAIAHRIVHGGNRFSRSVILDADAIDYLSSLSPLAPLHQPHNLSGVRAFIKSYPDVPQVGCFDTAFHATLPSTERLFALPKSLHEAGIRRYGFHGLSYRYVTDRLLERSARARGRMIIAHLGNGASACAVQDAQSIATTMGFSALDGLMMGTRSGSVDPGVLLHLLREGWTWEKLESMLYRESGLRGVSGIAADMRSLRASKDPAAAFAIDMFIHRLIRESGALSACLGGLDILAFTGGIGEHDSDLRQRVCDALSYLGVRIDRAANLSATGDMAASVHAADSQVEIWVVPTDEGRVAAYDAAALIS